MRTFTGRILTALTIVATLWGCGHGKGIERYEYLAKAPAVKAVVLLQPEFYFRNMQPYQVYQKWSDLARRFAQRTGVVLVAPDEYRVLVKGVLTNLAQETDLRTVLDGYGLEVEQAVAIRLALTESWQQEERSIVSEDGTRGLATEFKSQFECSADVYHVGTSRPLFSLTKQHKYRGAQLPSGADARPELTQFANECYDALLSVLMDEMTVAAGPRERGLAVVESPMSAMTFQLPEMAPLTVKLEQLDAIEADAVILSLIEYQSSPAPRLAVRNACAAREGLVVTSAAACSNLQVGDQILSVGSKPVHRAYQLGNEVQRARGTGRPVTIRFKRGKEEFQAVYGCDEEVH
jgi:hypothetical protein